MKVTSFGIIWIIFLIILTIYKKKYLPYGVVISAIFQAGAIFILSDKPISPLLFSCVYYIIIYLFYRKKKIIFARWFTSFFIMWLIVFFSSIVASIFFSGIKYMKTVDWVEYSEYDGHIAFVGLITILIYAITALLFYNDNIIKSTSLNILINLMVAIVFAVGIWQYLSLMHILPTEGIIADLIYSNSTAKENIYYYTMTSLEIAKIYSFRFHSTFMEPSHCAGFLVLAFTYYITKKKMGDVDTIMLIVDIAMILLTFSSTAYFATIICGLIVVLFSGSLRQIKQIILKVAILICVGIVFINMFHLWNTIERLIINKSSLNSYYIRGLWNINCLKIFVETFFVGLGYNNVKGSSFAISLLGSFGLIGTLLYLNFLHNIIEIKKIKRMTGDEKIITLSLIGVICTQFIAISLFDYSIFYMCVMLLMWTKNINRNFGGNNI